MRKSGILGTGGPIHFMIEQVKYKIFCDNIGMFDHNCFGGYKVNRSNDPLLFFQRLVLIHGLMLLFFFNSHTLSGQNSEGHNTLVTLPIVYFTPETNWAFGAGASYTFHLDSLKQRPSTLQLGGVYTLRKQILSYFSFNLFHPSQRWEMAGEMGYYKYVYKYWGIGNQLPESMEERYDVTFPRIKMAPKYILSDYWRFGLVADVNHYSDLNPESGGKLDEQQTIGIKGGFVNGAGVQIQFDSREHTIFPVSGWYISSKAVYYSNFLGSDYSFTASEVDVRTYQKISGGIIWASQVLTTFRSGPEIPFYHLSLLGGSRMMRGYFEGRFRDQNQWGIQSELRLPVWRRFLVVPFASAGDVFNFENYRRSVKFAGGLGVRFIVDHENRVNIRADVAYGQKLQFYLSILEAF